MPDKPPNLQHRVMTRLHGLFVGAPLLGHGHQLTWLQQAFHFWALIARSFVKNRLPVRAASLSYTTLLALVPLLAVAMGITSSLLKDESEDRIGRFVDAMVRSLVPPDSAAAPVRNESSPAAVRDAAAQESQPAPVELSPNDAGPATVGDSPAASVTTEGVLGQSQRDRVARQLKSFIQNTRSGALGIIGTAVLIVVAISMLIRIEDAFNEIWGVVKGRSPFMRLVLYWTVITLAPAAVVVAIGLASGPHFRTTQNLIAHIPLFGWLLFQLLPVLVLWLAFSTFYMLMPNTSVRLTAALMGGAVAAILWHLNNSLSALYVSRVVTYSKIYGGVGLVPVFMIGLYFAWMILLFGGQVSYAWQNRVAYLQERAAENVNQRGREFVALRLMTAIGATFQRGAKPPTLDDLALELKVPRRLAQQVLEILSASKLINEIAGSGQAYVPSRPIESISCHDILEALRAGQGNDLGMQREAVERDVYGEFVRIYEAEKQAAASISLLALADRANRMALDSGGDRSLPERHGEKGRGQP
jgi:membrane protein